MLVLCPLLTSCSTEAGVVVVVVTNTTMNTNFTMYTVPTMYRERWEVRIVHRRPSSPKTLVYQFCFVSPTLRVSNSKQGPHLETKLQSRTMAAKVAGCSIHHLQVLCPPHKIYISVFTCTREMFTPTMCTVDLTATFYGDWVIPDNSTADRGRQFHRHQHTKGVLFKKLSALAGEVKLFGQWVGKQLFTKNILFFHTLIFSFCPLYLHLPSRLRRQ